MIPFDIFPSAIAEPDPVRLSQLLRGSFSIRDVTGAPVRTFTIAAGTTEPALTIQVVDDTLTPVKLWGCSVTFHLVPRSAGNGIALNATGTIPAPEAGFVSYQWQEEDTVAGSYRAVFIVSDSFGNRITLPNGGGGIAVEIT